MLSQIKFKRLQHLIILFICLLVLISCYSNSSDNKTEELVLRSDINIQNADAKKIFLQGLDDIETKKYGAAKSCFLKADSLSPNSPLILNALGNLSAQSNRDSVTENYFSRALRIDSNFTKSYINYGVFLNNKTRYQEAINLFGIGFT